LERNENIASAAVFGCSGARVPKYGSVGSSLDVTWRFFRLVAGSNLILTAGVLGVTTDGFFISFGAAGGSFGGAFRPEDGALLLGGG